MSKRLLSLTLFSFCAAVALGAAGCSEVEEPIVPTYQTGLSKDELRNSAFAEQFPQQWKTYQQNTQVSDEDALKTVTMFKGSIPFHKNDDVNELPKGFPRGAQPYLKNLWAGYPFMWEYNEARGHTYAIEDILHIDRINQYDEKAGLPASCWNCKTAKIPAWVDQYGDDKFWSMDFNALRTTDSISMSDNTIGCANCHDPQTMELALSSVPLRDELKRAGKDWNTLSRNEKRGLVCGQCHVEYYFSEPEHGPNKKVVFPWANGMDPDQMYEYYKDKGKQQADGSFAAFADWTHPVSQIPMLKAQHPEFETWSNGPHGAAGVTCADCHMPYVRMDGKKKISSHLWTSPLRSNDMIDRSCRQCHSDKTAEFLRERVENTQKKTFKQLLTAQEFSVKAHESIRRASEWTGDRAENYDDLMAEAREWTRKGQFFWDYVSAENSVGFHNPVKALDTLALSQQYSQNAVNAAISATNYGIAKEMERDIKDLVPPILTWSREMQMDPANLEKHIWTRYLKLIPKSDRLWDGQEKRALPRTETEAAQPATVSMAPAAQ